MTARAKAAAAPLDGHGQPIEADALMECHDAFVTALPDGTEVSATRGLQRRGDDPAVRAYASKWKRAGAPSPPIRYTAGPWQPEAPRLPDVADYVVAERQIVAPVGGLYYCIERGSKLPRTHPVVAEHADCVRELTDDERAQFDREIAEVYGS